MNLRQLELVTTDLDVSLRFLQAIGWRIIPVSIQDQIILEVAENSSFGISLRLHKTKAKEAFGSLAYFETKDSLAELREKLSSLDFVSTSDIKAIAGYGKILIAEDSGGLKLGFYEPSTHTARPIS